MSIELFDEVILKDGRIGCITEIWDETHFSADIGMEEWKDVEVTIDDIREVVKHE